MNPVAEFFKHITIKYDLVGDTGCIIDGVPVDMTERSLQDLKDVLEFLDEIEEDRIVKTWDNHFLRDDYHIRRSAGIEVFPQGFEAYSLFQKEPYKRVEIFGGSLKWALEQAERVVNSCDMPCHRCIGQYNITGPNSPLLINVTQMIVCNICGNKRCPHVSDHRLECTGSNEVQ